MKKKNNIISLSIHACLIVVTIFLLCAALCIVRRCSRRRPAQQQLDIELQEADAQFFSTHWYWYQYPFNWEKWHQNQMKLDFFISVQIMSN